MTVRSAVVPLAMIALATPATATVRRVTTDAQLSAAVAAARSGDVITVASGDYGPIRVPRGVVGRAGAPITLRSETPHGAVVRQTDMQTAAIQLPAAKHWIVEGFRTIGGRNGIQASMAGNKKEDYVEDRMIRDIVIRNNLVEGVFDDAVKVNGGHDVTVRGNTLTGGRGQGVDVDAVAGFRVADNVVRCNNGRAGIISKMGATDGLVTGNTVSDCAQGIKAGDISDSANNPKVGAAYFPGASYEVARITITGNTVSSEGASIVFTGATDSSATGNRLAKRMPDGPMVLVRDSPGFTRHPTWYSRGVKTDAKGEAIKVTPGNAIAQ